MANAALYFQQLRRAIDRYINKGYKGIASVICNFMIIALKNIREWHILFHLITLNLHNTFSTNEINSALHLYPQRVIPNTNYIFIIFMYNLLIFF